MGTKRDPQTLKELERRRRLAAELLRRACGPPKWRGGSSRRDNL